MANPCRTVANFPLNLYRLNKDRDRFVNCLYRNNTSLLLFRRQDETLERISSRYYHYYSATNYIRINYKAIISHSVLHKIYTHNIIPFRNKLTLTLTRSWSKALSKIHSHIHRIHYNTVYYHMVGVRWPYRNARRRRIRDHYYFALTRIGEIMSTGMGGGLGMR